MRSEERSQYGTHIAPRTLCAFASLRQIVPFYMNLFVDVTRLFLMTLYLM